ncbi:hypothetical protein [Priestia megaterium]|uniref:hypothetical protein n=1 Tax=Priestia megaterium TaxID=1404 RepID=UPI0023DA0D9A|nr:hypothetical protein [Priestia megaterium]MDF2010195.1 hypothetical protein [Priestia megaterium]
MISGVFVGAEEGTVTVQVSDDGLNWTNAETFNVRKQLTKRHTRKATNAYIRFYSSVLLVATIYLKGE